MTPVVLVLRTRFKICVRFFLKWCSSHEYFRYIMLIPCSLKSRAGWKGLFVLCTFCKYKKLHNSKRPTCATLLLCSEITSLMNDFWLKKKVSCCGLHEMESSSPDLERTWKDTPWSSLSWHHNSYSSRLYVTCTVKNNYWELTLKKPISPLS